MKIINGTYVSPSKGPLKAIWLEIGGNKYGLTEINGHEFKFIESHWFIPSEEEKEIESKHLNLRKYFGDGLTEITLKFKE